MHAHVTHAFRGTYHNVAGWWFGFAGDGFADTVEALKAGIPARARGFDAEHGLWFVSVSYAEAAADLVDGLRAFLLQPALPGLAPDV